MLTTTKHLLAKNRVLPAFNFSTLEISRSIISAAEELKQPFIFELNAKELSFVGEALAVAVIDVFSREYSIDFSLHLDHQTETDPIIKGSKLGFSSGMLDISKLPRPTSTAALRKLQGQLPSNFLLEVSVRNLDEALLVEELGADLLAIETENYASLDTLAKVRKVTKLPFVMHGGSERSTKEIREAVALGVVKINFNSCLRHAWRLGLENTFKENPSMLQSYELLKRSCSLVKEVTKEKLAMVRKASVN